VANSLNYVLVRLQIVLTNVIPTDFAD
jgi:hypothetical protein